MIFCCIGCESQCSEQDDLSTATADCLAYRMNAFDNGFRRIWPAHAEFIRLLLRLLHSFPNSCADSFAQSDAAVTALNVADAACMFL